MDTKTHTEGRHPRDKAESPADGVTKLIAPFLKGSLTRLQSMREADFATVVGWLSDHRVTRYLTRGTFPSSLSLVRAEHEAMEASTKDVELAVIHGNSNSCIGVTGLHEVDWVARHAEFRILIGDPSAWGKGIGTEVCQLMCSYGFEILNLNKIYLGASVENRGAVRSYEKSGFRPEGILRQEVYRNSTYYDVARMSLLRHEYEAVLPSWEIADHVAKMFPRG